MIAAGLATLYAFMTTKYKKHIVCTVVKDAWALMQGSLGILWASWTLAYIMRHDLAIGEIMTTFIPLDAHSIPMLPFICFVITAIATASMGSAWGSMALMFPVVLPLYTQQFSGDNTLLFALIGAVISGATAGGHLSPLTDAMIMAATAAGCPHFDHVISHMIYASASVIATLVGFVVIGFGLAYAWPAIFLVPLTLTITTAVLFMCLTSFNAFHNRVFQK